MNRAAHYRRRIRNATARPPRRGDPLTKEDLAAAVRKLGGEPEGNIARHRFMLAATCGLDVDPFGASSPFTVDQLEAVMRRVETARTEADGGWLE